jgi:hypothetical protein
MAPTCKRVDGASCTLSNGSECLGGSCLTSYQDTDGDGYGGEAFARRCERNPQPGYVLNKGDRCDADPRANPGVISSYDFKNACGNYDWDSDGVEEKVDAGFWFCGCLMLANASICSLCY